MVGQGIAGTVLAQTLLKQGKSVVVIDDQELSQASRIAAGLYNPVVFKRLVKSWMADELIPAMDSFYDYAEQLLNIRFYFPQQIVKPFSEEQEKTLWLKKVNEDVGRYLGKNILIDFLNDVIHNPLGACEIIKAGNLNTALFLSSFRDRFKKNDCLLEEKCEYNKLVIIKESVTYKHLIADKIIFCEGYKTLDNPYFNWLPFKLTKGEILTVRIPLLQKEGKEKIINKGVFILPLGDYIYKVGATYEWNDLTEQTTERGKEELIEKLQKVLKIPFEIIDHQAGIRPTVVDRRPLIGLHPKHPALGVFNGMGTKGVMLAPYFANHFYNFLENEISLNKEVDIARVNYRSVG